MYRTGKSMNNSMLSYCELIDAKIRASDKDLPVLVEPESKGVCCAAQQPISM